jgi:hypothetical protein
VADAVRLETTSPPVTLDAKLASPLPLAFVSPKLVVATQAAAVSGDTAESKQPSLSPSRMKAVPSALAERVHSRTRSRLGREVVVVLLLVVIVVGVVLTTA